MTQNQRLMLAGLVMAAAVAGCTKADTAENIAGAAWLETRNSVSVRQVTLDPSACNACIGLEEVAELGKSDNPDGFVNFAFRVYRDAKSRYWVVQGSEIKLFDSRGEYLRKVGAAGSGPGEWRSPWFATDSDGRITIADASTGRVTELDGGFKVVAETPLPGLQINSIAPTGPNSFVVNAWAVAADMVGQPIHIFENGQIVRSFGAPKSGVLTDFTGQRLVSGDGRGHVVVSKPYSLDLEVWTDQGERVVGISGPPLNSHEVLPGRYDFDRNPLASEVRGVRLDSLGRLWVLTWRVKDDWKTKYEERVYPNGMKTLALKAGFKPKDSRFSRIEVIDVATGRIIAHVDRPELFAGFVGSVWLWENRMGDETPTVAIWRMQPLGVSPEPR